MSRVRSISSVSPSGSSPAPSASPATAPSTCRRPRQRPHGQRALEKQQVQVLAERIDRSCSTRWPAGSAPDVPHRRRRSRRSTRSPFRVDEEFRVGAMGLGWDADSRRPIVIEAARRERGGGRRGRSILDDSEEGPDALRVFLSPVQARAFADACREGRLGGPPAVPAVRPAARPHRPRLPAAERLPPLSARSRSDRRSRGPARPGRPRAAAPRADRRSPAGLSTRRT